MVYLNKETLMDKKFYLSKTLWVNLLGIIGIVFFSGDFPVEYSATVLAVINFVLRLATKEPVVWK